MKAEFGFGKTVLGFEVPNENYAGTLEMRENSERAVSVAEELKRALQHPIHSKRLKDMVLADDKIVIITSDITRPLPTDKILPYLLDELYLGGAKKENITLVFALGAHRKHTPQEMRMLAGKRASEEIRLIDSDVKDCTYIGTTTYGTPVSIFREVAQSDIRICLGNIEYHYFAGYSGGAKAIMPGVSTREAIQANHSKMVLDGSRAGALEGNPVRLDIEEAAGMLGVHFILNVVLDEKKEVLKAFAGDCLKAHRAGCAFLDGMYLCKLKQRADIVVVSQGGYPKDLNLYQTQKALENAKYAVKEGGIIILVGACQEGLGEEVFEKWLLHAPDARSLIDRIQTEFELGGHKAAAIAMVLQDARVFLVSELQPDFVRTIFLEPFYTIQSALDKALEIKGDSATVLLMPHGGSTLPCVMQ